MKYHAVRIIFGGSKPGFSWKNHFSERFFCRTTDESIKPRREMRGDNIHDGAFLVGTGYLTKL